MCFLSNDLSSFQIWSQTPWIKRPTLRTTIWTISTIWLSREQMDTQWKRHEYSGRCITWFDNAWIINLAECCWTVRWFEMNKLLQLNFTVSFPFNMYHLHFSKMSPKGVTNWANRSLACVAIGFTSLSVQYDRASQGTVAACTSDQTCSVCGGNRGQCKGVAQLHYREAFRFEDSGFGKA